MTYLEDIVAMLRYINIPTSNVPVDYSLKKGL
jgi:hypothetical protein